VKVAESGRLREYHPGAAEDFQNWKSGKQWAKRIPIAIEK
jgi:hypothetical protein